MKLIFFISFLANISFIYSGLLENSAVRTGMQSLACNLFRKYDDLKKLDENFIKIAKDNTKHNSFSSESLDYKGFLSKLRGLDELGIQYLVYKMLYGDKLASKFYTDLINKQKESLAKNETQTVIPEKIDEKQVLDRIRKIVDMTNGFGADNYATFQAVEYLEKSNFGMNSSKCMPNLFNKAQISFLEKRLKKMETKYSNRMKLLSTNPLIGWIGIKFFKNPKNGLVTSLEYWKKGGENFPAVIDYGKSDAGKACIFTDPEVQYIDSVEGVQKKQNCDIQIVSDATEDTRESEIVPINISKDTFNVKFYVSENRLDYNCIGWALGLQDFLNTNIYNERSQEVKTKDEFFIYLTQFAEAIKYIEKNPMKKNYSLIMSKKKPAPSLIDSLVKSNFTRGYLESHIAGLNNNITQADIEKLCVGDFNGAAIFYGQGGKMTHGARYVKELKLWTSKLGQSYLVTHNLESLSDSPTEKSLYGFPKFLYCPGGLTKAEVPGGNASRTDFS